ncbi:MAG: MerR family transcriptional regulator [Rhodoglobus sp.]
MEQDHVSPRELSRDLGVSERTIRHWLRATYPRPEVEKHSRWQLTKDEVAEARERLS